MSSSESNSIERFRLVAEYMSDLVCLHEPDGTYNWVSPSVVRLLGYAPETLVGTDPYELIHPDDRVRIRQGTHEPAQAGNSNIPVRYRIRHADGSYIWFETLTQSILRAGRVAMLHTTSRDVTDKVAMEEQLAESEALYRSVVETMAEGVLVHAADGTITTLNRQASHLLGLSASRLRGRHFPDPGWRMIRRDGSPLPGDEQPAMVTLRTGRPCRNVVIGLYQPRDDEHRWLSVNARPVDGLSVDSQEKAAVVVSFDDITEYLRREMELQVWSAVYEHSDEAILITDQAGVIRDMNQAFVDQMSAAPKTFGGVAVETVAADASSAVLINDEVLPRARNEGNWRGEFWIRDTPGEIHPVWASVSWVEGSVGLEPCYIFIISDIAERLGREQRLRHEATHDVLTGLPNRTLLDDRLDMALHAAERNDSRAACIYLDLDGFKPVNDRHGHAAGDKLLQQVAERLSAELRDSDTLARIGGDEFVVVASEVMDQGAVEAIVDKLVASLLQPFVFDELHLTLGVSAGVSLFPDHGRDPARLMDQADEAMYQAKGAGGTCYRFYAAAGSP